MGWGEDIKATVPPPIICFIVTNKTLAKGEMNLSPGTVFNRRFHVSVRVGRWTVKQSTNCRRLNASYHVQRLIKFRCYLHVHMGGLCRHENHPVMELISFSSCYTMHRVDNIFAGNNRGRKRTAFHLAERSYATANDLFRCHAAWKDPESLRKGRRCL